MTVRPRIDAERVFERAHSDPAFDAALRGAYRGRHDVLDALWWAAHPLADSAKGLPDPAVEIRALQRAAFARASDPARAAENMRRLQEAEHLLAQDAQLLADAVEAAEQASEPQPVDAQEVEPDATPRTRRKLLLPVVSGVALLAAIIVLPSLMQLDADADPASTVAASPPDRVHTDIITLGAEGNVSDPLAILERPQAAGDQPPGELRFDVGSYRALPDLAPQMNVYLAKGNQPDTICLVVMGAEDEIASTCLTATEFTDGELRLGRGRYQVSSEMTILTESYSLMPNGDFRYAATARVTGNLASPGTGSVVRSNLD